MNVTEAQVVHVNGFSRDVNEVLKGRLTQECTVFGLEKNQKNISRLEFLHLLKFATNVQPNMDLTV